MDQTGLTKAGKPRKNKPGAGRPTLYDPKYCQELIKYFDIEPSFNREIVHTNSKSGSEWSDIKEVPNAIRFLSKFADHIGVTRDTLYQWAKDHKEFSDAITRAKGLREEMIAVNALKGLYNPMFSMFYLKNRYEGRYKDKTEIDAKMKSEVTFREEQDRMIRKAKEILKSRIGVPMVSN